MSELLQQSKKPFLNKTKLWLNTVKELKTEFSTREFSELLERVPWDISLALLNDSFLSPHTIHNQLKFPKSKELK
jgi:hypothetical protein